MPKVPAARIITLTTDFGTADHYVGVMKGVILSICPQARIVDISHEVQPFQVRQAAFLIDQARRFFPPKTVHLVVVDPGVGTARRGLAVESHGQYFVGPDNGVFGHVAAEGSRAYEITNPKYRLPEISATFHGRDIFAPAAAHLAAGVPPERLGPSVTDPLRVEFQRPLRYSRRTWTATVLHADRFGNLVTNIRAEDFPRLERLHFELAVGFERITAFVKTFGESSPGELICYLGSSGYLEIAVNQGNAAQRLGVGPGAPVEITFSTDPFAVPGASPVIIDDTAPEQGPRND